MSTYVHQVTFSRIFDHSHPPEIHQKWTYRGTEAAHVCWDRDSWSAWLARSRGSAVPPDGSRMDRTSWVFKKKHTKKKEWKSMEYIIHHNQWRMLMCIDMCMLFHRCGMTVPFLFFAWLNHQPVPILPNLCAGKHGSRQWWLRVSCPAAAESFLALLQDARDVDLHVPSTLSDDVQLKNDLYIYLYNQSINLINRINRINQINLIY